MMALTLTGSSLSFASVDHQAALVVSTGRGCFLVKAYIKKAYVQDSASTSAGSTSAEGYMGKCSVHRQSAIAL